MDTFHPAEIRHAVTIGTETTALAGILLLPPIATGLLIFAHGSGSNHLSPRNAMVAESISKFGFASLLFDLLTPEEQRDRANVFDIPLLTKRLGAALRWARSYPSTHHLPISLFGASTGAAAAINAAANSPQIVSTVISRGGRPDLADHDALRRVKAPTLFILGSEDSEVIPLNHQAADLMACKKEFAYVPGATHLFDEPGAMDEVIKITHRWLGNIAIKKTAPRI